MLFDQTEHALLQHGAFSRVERFRGQNDHRDVLMFGVFLEQVEKCKAVHLRHKQIEKDYARRCLIDALEPRSTIRRPVDRASLALKQLSDEINDVRIVINHEDAPIVRSNSGQEPINASRPNGFTTKAAAHGLKPSS